MPHFLTEVCLGDGLHLRENQSADLLGCQHQALRAPALHLDMGPAAPVNDTERERLAVHLYAAVLESTSDEALGVIDDLLR
mmetsp:Transcript_55217/g.139953  ORF Transcript_55217/g.139953 Transcript_55217/m.139953 type:complete len:81 (+) Transcript_55217:1681-1923(+)